MTPWRSLLRSVPLVVLVTLVIGWAPPAAAGPTATVRADPSTDLIDLQVISVSGSGFTPGATVRVSECLAAAVNRCDITTEAFPSADGNGAFTLAFRVRREIFATVGSAEKADCATVAGGCAVVGVNTGNTRETASTVLAFDPKEPALRYGISVDARGTVSREGFVVDLSGRVRCSQPARLAIVGSIVQDARDPNSGYPFFTFADCDGFTGWATRIVVEATPSRPRR